VIVGIGEHEELDDMKILDADTQALVDTAG